MAENWDTFGCFEALLDNFEKLLDGARNLRTSQEASLSVMAAIIGFGQFCPIPDWSGSHFEFIQTRLRGEISIEELSWYGECAEAMSVFSCLALGALLGKRQADATDDAGFLLGDAHLPAFLSLHDEAIYERYSA